MEVSKFLVNGEWCSSARRREVFNPYSGKSVGEVYQASKEDIDKAISAAVDAFEKIRDLASFDRRDILSRVSRRIEDRRQEFAELITTETGKPIAFSRAEVERAILTFAVAAEEATRLEGEILPLDMNAASRGRTALVRRFPLGPIGAITPFNFPLNLVAHKLGPAIAAGCPVVLKPSSNAPMTALLLGRMIVEAGLPEGRL